MIPEWAKEVASEFPLELGGWGLFSLRAGGLSPDPGPRVSSSQVLSPLEASWGLPSLFTGGIKHNSHHFSMMLLL